MQSRLVILDANIIIEAHRLGLWQHMLNQLDICVPATVIEDEAWYFISRTGKLSGIDLKADIRNGKLKRIEATVQEMESLQSRFKGNFLERLDPGESEALALVNSGNYEEHYFCSAEKPAVQALAMLHKGSNAVSLEQLLRETGKTCKLTWQFTDDFTKKMIAIGLRDAGFYVNPLQPVATNES